jgi:hypothetical protein
MICRKALSVRLITKSLIGVINTEVTYTIFKLIEEVFIKINR